MIQQLNIYVSGKITGLDETIAAAKFQTAAERLRRLGHNAFNPMQMFPQTKNWTYIDYIVADLRCLLKKCDSIYMLDNWKDSRGAKIELAVAQAENYAVYFEGKNEPKQHKLTLI